MDQGKLEPLVDPEEFCRRSLDMFVSDASRADLGPDEFVDPTVLMFLPGDAIALLALPDGQIWLPENKRQFYSLLRTVARAQGAFALSISAMASATGPDGSCEEVALSILHSVFGKCAARRAFRREGRRAVFHGPVKLMPDFESPHRVFDEAGGSRQ